ncbi:hypothetical protein [Chthonobacter albigriseus]|uniref:flagellin N-terminal helical domain-containing protein n=1 Tax=Chthonobacter albigriseus TaxID=1683161 RepID=UPI0015EED5B9|nr:hypothetical protein [Chthonobacter albigriseus]
MSEVNLTRATRENLTALRTAIEQAGKAGNRMATGVKVQTALDQPSSYFSSQALGEQAADLNRILEKIGQGIQVVRAADQGLTSIEDLLQVARANVERAQASLSAFERADIARDFNAVLKQVSETAADSGYQGRNLLGGDGNDLKLYFSDQLVNAVTIKAVDLVNIKGSLDLEPVEVGHFGTLEVDLALGSVASADTRLIGDASNFTDGDVITVKNAAGETVALLEITDQTRVSDLLKAFRQPNLGLRASFEDSKLTIETADTMTITGGTAGGAFENATIDAIPSEWLGRVDIDDPLTPEDDNRLDLPDMLTRVRAAILTTRDMASSFGTSFAMLQSRESFMKGFAGTLLSGAEQAVAADRDEEAANLLALNVRQQFASNALSFTTEADQGVLRMLGG